MPTYDYLCSNCEKKFEVMQPITEHPLHLCPGCGNTTLQRQIGAGIGVIFKGSGFYATDYKKG